MSKQPAHDKAKAKAKAEPANRTIALNKRARHEYHLIDRVEAGLALQGWEVKSIRAGRANLTDGYAYVQDGEIYLIGAQITPLIQPPRMSSPMTVAPASCCCTGTRSTS